jgi:hypothetical protein
MESVKQRTTNLYVESLGLRLWLVERDLVGLHVLYCRTTHV